MASINEIFFRMITIIKQNDLSVRNVCVNVDVSDDLIYSLQRPILLL